MKDLPYFYLYQYFERKDTILSERYDNLTARILYHSEGKISEADIYELFKIKTQLEELRRIEKDLTSLCR